MKILITGSNGQLGTELQNQLNDRNITYVAFNKSELDITNFSGVNSIILKENPQVVINCAAYTNVDGCEKNEISAFKVNGIGAQNLAIATNKMKCKIVHISTDYVFDGEGNIPYREYNRVNPQSIYGESKLLGEKLVEKFNPKHFIIRTSWLYGEGNNFVKTMLNLASYKDELGVVDDQLGSPTSTVDLTRSIIDLMETDHYGIFHGTCEGSCSWYDFAKRIFELKGIDIKLNKITTKELNRLASRPKYSILDNFMLKLLGLNTFRHWEDSLKEYLRNEV
ncbi:MAG: dTDP-4-dehydrorhamnose reductase [Anaeromicrobium sp.]|jgi:dTDP-4-dehydrorhamnose reductase|uniref:dTDP-4-dehydrorhamnose reductase n=1 Tax=Anaeromicrobium sp. TaxID=1929132 RepID=UPI0025CBBB1F|nr:dTDP-4-dehydrorhamnose reductase [Anaeromicrobium sp.]MCT4594419.1 dTDP-4-dehydrorhamnose reductase [Anaeromicrobium sp.]